MKSEDFDQTPPGFCLFFFVCFLFSYATEKLPDSRRGVATHTEEEEEEEEEERRAVRRPVYVGTMNTCVECVPHMGACLYLWHHVPKSALASASAVVSSSTCLVELARQCV